MSQLVDHQIQEQQEASLRPFITQRGVKLAKPEPMIGPWRHEQLQPASYDLRLGRQLRNESGLAWTMRSGTDSDAVPHLEDLEPGRFVLGHTEEFIIMPPHLCGRVEGKSSVGRRGLAVHVTAGFIDPGFRGQITLELKYQGTLKHMKVYPGMLIAQITFHLLAGRPRRLYGDPTLGSHYQGQLGATGPRG